MATKSAATKTRTARAAKPKPPSSSHEASPPNEQGAEDESPAEASRSTGKSAATGPARSRKGR
jgi:hypothetical protein